MLLRSSRLCLALIAVAALSLGCGESVGSESVAPALVQQVTEPAKITDPTGTQATQPCDPRMHTLSLDEMDPLGCTASDAQIDEARDECESRAGLTELRQSTYALRCYSVTIAEDGWRMCSLSEPYLMVRTDDPYVSQGCNDGRDRYPVDEDERAAELLWPPSAVAPEGCDSAVDWFKSYLRSMRQALVDEQAAVTSAVDAATITAAYARLGPLLEQGSPRAEAVRDSCFDDLGIEAMGVTSAMYEIEDELNEAYRTLVEDCITHGGIDCGVLAPTAKKSCEGMSPHYVFLLDEITLGMPVGLGVWPSSARGIGCTSK